MTVASALLALPWLNPFAPGPSPAVVPWLVSLGCLGIWLSVWPHYLGGAGSRILPGGLPKVRHKAHLDWVAATAWLAAALVSALVGLVQQFELTHWFAPWVNASPTHEVYGNLRQRNQFASLMNIGLLALLWRCSRVNTMAVLALLAAALLGAATAASLSRTGLVHLLGITALAWGWGLLKRPFAARVVALALVAYLAASWLLPWSAGQDPASHGIWGRLRDSQVDCGSRLTMWGNVLHLIAQKPWLGWGWGELDYAHFITLYPGPPAARFCEILDNAHNLPLQLAVELGVPFAVLFCGAGLWLIGRGQFWREQNPTRQLAWGVMVVVLLHSLLEYPLWYGPFLIAIGLCVALLWTTPQKGTQNSPKPVETSFLEIKRPIVLVVIQFIAMLIIAFVAYAGWDYWRISQIYLAPESRAAAYRAHTLAKIKGSWLFANQVKFAELTTTTVTPANAADLNAMAHEVLHFSPEARVVQKLVESAHILGRPDEVAFFKRRYEAAYPGDYAVWVKNAAQSLR